jgi:hypothetical protein
MGPVAEDLLGKAGIDGARRAEELSVREYEYLAVVSAGFSDIAKPARR